MYMVAGLSVCERQAACDHCSGCVAGKNEIEQFEAELNKLGMYVVVAQALGWSADQVC